MKHARVHLTALVLLLAIPDLGHSASAESLSNVRDLRPGTRIATYLASQEQAKALYDVGVQWDRKLGLHANCKSQYRVVRIAFVVIKPIYLPDDQLHPTEGIWQHRFEFIRCGERKIYNAIFVARTGETPDVKSYYPGNSMASHVLLNDAIKTAYAAAYLKSRRESQTADCSNSELVDTLLVQSPRDVSERGTVYRGVWEEAWTFLICGEMVEVPMEFVPTEKRGTTFFSRSRVEGRGPIGRD